MERPATWPAPAAPIVAAPIPAPETAFYERLASQPQDIIGTRDIDDGANTEAAEFAEFSVLLWVWEEDSPMADP